MMIKKITITALLCVLCLYGSIAQNKYEVPRLSPLPASVEGIKDPVLSLNGTWSFQTASISPASIRVPSEWTMEGFDVPEGEAAYYSRCFEVPADWIGKRIMIRFDAVSSYGKVSVNNKVVGEHEGGMVPFEVDITNAVTRGTNKLQVEVRAWTISDRLGCISQYACHTVGGLVRKVSLFALPQTNIASMDVVTRLDKSYKNATLDIRTELDAAMNSGEVTIRHSLINVEGKVVAEGKKTVAGDSKVETSLKVNNARLWNTEEPYLYTLKTTLSSGGELLQTNEQRVGLRQVVVDGNKFMINGKQVKLRGVNRHEAHPVHGRSLTPELCRQDAELFKAGNCNYIRTSHYPPSEEFLDACDEIGLFVESESALNWIQHGSSPIWRHWNYEDDQYLPYLVRANIDNVLAGRRHPSIIIWSIANESRWSHLWEKVRDVVKDLDSSRPNSFHDQCWGGFNNAGSMADIANYHYPGLNGPAACDTMSRPTLFGEYAHLTCYNSREMVTDPGVRALYAAPLVEMLDTIYAHPACLGGAIWSGIDDIFHLSDGRIVGYGPWGPIDGWRREKPEYTGMKKAYTPFRILGSERTDKELILTVENRYNFIGFDKVKIEAGEANGNMFVVKSSIPARKRGKINIPLKNLSGKDIYLKVTEPQGNVCHEELFRVHKEVIVAEKPQGQLKVNETKDALHVVWNSGSDSKTLVFSKATGNVTQAFKPGKILLSQGPQFCMVAMNNEDGGKPVVAGETYQNNIYPLKNYPHLTMYASVLNHRKDSEGNVIVDVEQAYRNGDTGRMAYQFGIDGKIKVTYHITIGANEIRPRQYGIIMQLPRSMETLNWKRNGDFTVYPEHDIARNEGTARLNANNQYEVEAWRPTVQKYWKDDANALGSVDFRSTKDNIIEASLTDRNGNGVLVHGDGTQAVRSWLQDSSIHLLIANYNNEGSEPFYGSPFTKKRKVVKKGDVLTGEVTIELK